MKNNSVSTKDKIIAVLFFTLVLTFTYIHFTPDSFEYKSLTDQFSFTQGIN